MSPLHLFSRPARFVLRDLIHRLYLGSLLWFRFCHVWLPGRGEKKKTKKVLSYSEWDFKYPDVALNFSAFISFFLFSSVSWPPNGVFASPVCCDVDCFG